MDTVTADAHFAAWMRDHLDHAARHFGLVVIGKPVLGARLRSISARATGPDGERWLRVVSQEPEWASGEHWTGTVDANSIAGIRKPSVLDVYEWSEGRDQRAEVMTLLPGEVCSSSDALRAPIVLSDRWWADLRGALATLADVPTSRTYADQEKVHDRIRGRFGPNVETTVTQWETVHGDLHGNNLLCPNFALLDWELWGRGPAGLDAASLFYFSLLTPGTAEQVRTAFAAKLDAPTGRIAQLYVAARLLRRIEGGDFADLEGPVRTHARTLVNA